MASRDLGNHLGNQLAVAKSCQSATASTSINNYPWIGYLTVSNGLGTTSTNSTFGTDNSCALYDGAVLVVSGNNQNATRYIDARVYTSGAGGYTHKTSTTFASTNNNLSGASLLPISSTTVIALFNDSGSGIGATLLTWNGTSLTAGTTVYSTYLSMTNDNWSSLGVTKLGDNTILATFTDSSFLIKATVITITGTSISFGAVQTLGTASNVYQGTLHCSTLSSSRVALVRIFGGGVSVEVSLLGVSGSIVSQISSTTFANNSTSTTSSVPRILSVNATTAIMVYNATNNSTGVIISFANDTVSSIGSSNTLDFSGLSNIIPNSIRLLSSTSTSAIFIASTCESRTIYIGTYLANLVTGTITVIKKAKASVTEQSDYMFDSYSTIVFNSVLNEYIATKGRVSAGGTNFDTYYLIPLKAL